MEEKKPSITRSLEALRQTASDLIELAAREPDNPTASQGNQEIIDQLIKDRQQQAK